MPVRLDTCDVTKKFAKNRMNLLRILVSGFYVSCCYLCHLFNSIGKKKKINKQNVIKPLLIM